MPYNSKKLIMNPNWKKATFTMSDQELKTRLTQWDAPEYTPRFPKLLKLFMGKGRPKYRWQIWLSRKWPKKMKPVATWNSTRLVGEMNTAITEAIIADLMNKVKTGESK